MSYSYNRISVPVSLAIPGGLKPGKQIILRGRVTNDNDQFAINVREEKESGDILLHFNPRQREGVVIRNSCAGGNWGGEEKDQSHFPFGRGVSFLFRIDVAEEGFHTYINGRPFINFRHRLDPSKGRFLQLGAGVEYYDISFQDKYVIPYKTKIPGKMQVGKAVRVRGAGRGSNGFAINFACDGKCENIAFHFNPRPSQGGIAMNSNLGGWGGEERDFEGDYPFNNEMFFDIMFVCTTDKFHVYVNEEYFADYNHRCDLTNITHLHVVGEVDIANVEFLEPVDDHFVKQIPSGLEEGDILVFKGFMKPDSERFAINLHYGLNISSDVALHLNPRIGENQIVFNSRTGGSWANEERIDLPSCIAKRQPFEIEIVTESSKFKVYVNGDKCKKFESRGDIESIQGINVTSGVYMYHVKLERKLHKPVLERIPGTLIPGSWIIIYGMPKKKCESFYINLKCGSDASSDIAFHFNPRFGGEQCTVRNSRMGGSWQHEERGEASFPFERKDVFEVVIKVLEDKFMTYVNGERHIEFKHRMPLDRICHLEMDGRAEFYETEFL